MRRSTLSLFVGAALLLGACQLSLAGDITPPSGSELQVEEAAAEPLAFPDATPDPENGALIFAQSCAPCHGVGGLGDGAQAGQLPVAVPAIGDPELAQVNSPEDWYTIISQGNLDSYMPPFAQSLSVQERWDVLAYAYSLSQDAELAASGSTLAPGYGVNPGNLQAIASYTQADLADAIASDLEITDDEGQALAAYLQASALGLPITEAVSAPEVVEPTPDAESAEAPLEAEPATDTEAEPATGGVIVAGTVSNGSGGDLPTGSEVLLRGFNDTSEVFNRNTELAADGSFQFEPQELDPSLVYAVTIDYEGLIYFSEAISADDGLDAYDLPLTIYDTTSDTSDLAIETLQLVLDFSSEGVVRVVQLVTVSNAGDHAVTPVSDEEPVLLFGLPPEARNLAFQSGAIGDRYVPTDGGFGDLRAVLPGSGEYQMLYAYELPYSRGLDYQQALFLPVKLATVFTPSGQIEINSSAFTSLGAQDLNGESYTGYQSLNTYAAGDTLEFEISGTHPLGASNPLLDVVSQDDFLIGLIGLTLAVAVLWLWLRRLNAPGPNPDEIMDAIIALDARYAEDGIGDDAYLKRRAALKERLRQALAARGAKPK